MPQLVAHQLRVAAVAYAITQEFFESLHDEELISACLLHDMGNILKFDLSLFPEYLTPQGRDYWEGVKEEYRVKYGSDEHAATLAIAREIGVSERTLSYIDAVGFWGVVENEKSDSFEKKIAAYADMRVAPYGITTLVERMDDANRRYATRWNEMGHESKVAASHAMLRSIEKQIFARASNTPDDITAEACEKYIPMLKKYHIT
jgi:hypothetical protein